MKFRKNNPTPGDFICLVKKDLESISEPFYEEKIVSMSKQQLKAHIKKKLEQAVFEDLKQIQMSHSKIRDIQYLQFKTQPYLTNNTFIQDMKGLLFSLRSSMTRNIKNNFSSLNTQNLQCKMNCTDSNTLDCQAHLLQCKELAKLLSDKEKLMTKGVKY